MSSAAAATVQAWAAKHCKFIPAAILTKVLHSCGRKAAAVHMPIPKEQFGAIRGTTQVQHVEPRNKHLKPILGAPLTEYMHVWPLKRRNTQCSPQRSLLLLARQATAELTVATPVVKSKLQGMPEHLCTHNTAWQMPGLTRVPATKARQLAARESNVFDNKGYKGDGLKGLSGVRQLVVTPWYRHDGRVDSPILDHDTPVSISHTCAELGMIA